MASGKPARAPAAVRRKRIQLNRGDVGRTPATAALARALRQVRASHPETGEPFDEALLFGVGGGFGATYVVQEQATYVSLHLGGRQPQRQGDFIETAARRLGHEVSARVSQTPAAAEKALRAALTSGRPVVALVDQAFLPTCWIPRETAGTTLHPVLVGLADGEPLITDLGPNPFRWTWSELASARGRVRGERYRFLAIGARESPLDLAGAIRAGLHDVVIGMRSPGSSTSGLPALKQWVRLLRSPDDPLGWETLLRHPIRLMSGLVWIEHFTHSAGTGGGNYRPLFADFLDQAAGILGDRNLKGLAGAYRSLGREWTAFVRLALPDSVPGLRQLRLLAERKRRLLSEGGGNVTAELAEIATGRWNVFERVARVGALEGLGPVRPFLDGLADALEKIVEGETRAIGALGAAIGISGE